MITFHKLTLAQYEAAVGKGNQMVDGLYFLTDVGVIKLHNGEGSVTTFGTSIKIVNEFPNQNDVQQYCIYSHADTKEQRMWDGDQWQILSYPIINEITSGIALSTTIDEEGITHPATTVPNTYSVYNYVQDRVAAAELGVQIRLHTPVYSLQQLHDLPLFDVEDKCMILVQNVGLYRYDANSYDYDDPNTDAVVTPKEIEDSVPEGESIDRYKGRWIKMFNNVGYVAGDGVVISANPNDLNKLIYLNVNKDQFEFDAEGRLVLKADGSPISAKVDKVFARPDEIPVWRNDGNQDASGYKFNTTDKLTNLSTSISPDSTISTFVREITDKKLDDVSPNSDGKIIIGKGNDGKIDASKFNIGSDFDNLTPEFILNIPKNTVATERAVKWYIDRSLSFNNDNIGETLSSMIDPY